MVETSRRLLPGAHMFAESCVLMMVGWMEAGWSVGQLAVVMTSFADEKRW